MQTPPRVQTLALIGNPNTGKTTLFNALTGLSQQAGNYPGVTVEHKVGTLTLATGTTIELVDLPGTYSLAAHSPDEMLAVDVLLGQQQDAPPIDGILAIVDASNLRRNLYLVSQLAETDLPMVIALNMTDVALKREIIIDAEALSQKIGAPVVPICAHRREDLDELRSVLAELSNKDPGVSDVPVAHQHRVTLPDALLQGIGELQALATRPLSAVEALRALADEDSYAENRFLAQAPKDAPDKLAILRATDPKYALSELESNARYAWIDHLLTDALSQPTQAKPNHSDRADQILTHRFFGTLAFLLINALVFQAIYAWSSPLMDGVDTLFTAVGRSVSALIPPGPLQSLIVDGLIAGVGGVLIFLPQIAILFFFIALLEDSGYMARAALLMDRRLTRIGLSGTSFIPLLSSFACAIPGIMGARVIADRNSRLTTIFLAPFMSCSARLPVYTLLIGAFIPQRTVGGFLELQGLFLLPGWG